MDNFVTEEELDYVAARVRPSESRRLLRKLGLNDVTIEQVFHDFEKAGSREQLYQGLLRCKEAIGSGFTFGDLAKALEITGRADLVEDLTVEMLDLQPGENKVQVKVTVRSEVSKFELSSSFIGSEEDAKSIQNEILENLEKRKNDQSLLLQCKEMIGRGFTPGELVNALEIIGRADLAEGLTTEMLDPRPGENKVLVTVSVKSQIEMTRFEMTKTFIGRGDDAKSIQSELVKNLEMWNDKCKVHVLQPHDHGHVPHIPSKRSE
ncbi:uncharacterized protein LOC144886115 [Branchiostoma floridae x Branchiostoma japonicum]